MYRVNQALFVRFRIILSTVAYFTLAFAIIRRRTLPLSSTTRPLSPA